MTSGLCHLNRLVLLALLLAFVTTVVAGCSPEEKSRPKLPALTGTIQTRAESINDITGECEVEQENALSETVETIRKGLNRKTEITVRDASGRILANEPVSNLRVKQGTCVARFRLPRLARSSFYELEVSQVEGKLRYRRSELQRAGWAIGLGVNRWDSGPTAMKLCVGKDCANKDL